MLFVLIYGQKRLKLFLLYLITMLIPNFIHHPGVHCESTAVRNLLAFDGLLLSEPMVFGLGSGLNFIYWDMKRMPFPFIGGRVRPGELSANLAENLGFDLVVEETGSREKAWANLKRDLSENRPVGLKLDMFYLPYFRNPPHFPAHYVVACGFDEKSAFLADTDFKTIQEVPISDLQKARSARGFFSSRNLSFKVANVPDKINFPSCIRKAVRKTAAQMLYPPIKNLGISGIRKFSSEILDWQARSGNPKRDFESFYTLFEKAGTGGAGFRNLYHDFLRECLAHVSSPHLQKAHIIFSELASAWTEISEKIRQAPNSKSLSDELEKISGLISLQADREEKAMRCLRKV